MLTSRLLPHDEWHKLLAFEPYKTQGLPPEQGWLIVAVERDGALIASSAIFDAVHWDVFAIAEADQKNPAVAKRLITEAMSTIAELGINAIHLTLDPERSDLAALAQHFGFVESPLRLYIRAIPPAQE